MIPSTLLVLFSSMFPLARANLDLNELIGTPIIQCNTDTIEMSFNTRTPFSGKVYVKGNYNRPECRVDYGERTADGRPKGGIRLNHGACNMDRQRTMSEGGMMFSTVLVVSFHKLFITKVDRAFNIKCMYKEAERTITQSIDVSSLPTESISYDMPMPTCSYTIRRDQLDGPILTAARVGDQVVHRWECDSEMYGVLVHSCYVEDGQGEKQMVIDANGCHTDHTLLGDPTYVEALNMAYRESYVFKFADRAAVRFICEIKLCFKDDGGCDGVTPPVCYDAAHNRINALNTNINVTRRRRSAAVHEGDLISQTVYVLEKEEDGEESDPFLPSSEVSSSTPSGVCLSPSQVLGAGSFLAIVLLVLISLAVYTLLHKCRSPKEEDSDYYLKY